MRGLMRAGLVTAVIAAACGTGACDGASGDAGGDETAADTGAETSSTGDGTASETGDDPTGTTVGTTTVEDAGTDGTYDAAGGDSPEADAGPAADTEDPDAPLFVLGVNETAKVAPQYFSELPEGEELLIEYGPQGLWMVVLAFKTRNIFEPPLQIIAKVDVGGVEQGLLGLGKQKLQIGGDGFDYFYNLYLVVDDPTVTGQAGLVTIEVTDDHGGAVTEERGVLLTGGKTD